jgi:hypothetical protein
MSASARFSLNAIDWKKIGKGALIAAASALLTYGTTIWPGLPIGWWTPLVTAGWGVVVNAVRKWIEKQSTPTA